MEQQWSTVFEDQRLSAIDKACYVFISMRGDVTGEYRHGIRYLSRALGIKWHTARRALQHLVEANYVGPAHVDGPHPTWRILHTMDPDASFGHYHVPLGQPRPRSAKFAPQDSPRMAMPPDLASDILHHLIVRRRELDAALTSDMQAITDDDRKRWQAESDRIEEEMDLFTRWMTRFGDGIPEDRQHELES